MKLFSTLLLAILMPLSTYAAAMSCENYTGTWRGTLVDNGKLFGNGGPWPVSVTLYQNKGKIWGRTSAVKTAKGQTIFPANEIWARCEEAKMKDIFWGSNHHCGALSQQGGLSGKNKLTMEINWENAMTGTHLTFNLKRINKLSPYYETEHVNAYDPSKIATCH